MVTRSITPPLIKTIVTANDAIIGIGMGTEKQAATGIVAEGTEGSATAALTATGGAQTARVTRKNAGETNRTRMIATAYAVVTMRKVLLVVPAMAAACEHTGGSPDRRSPHHSYGHHSALQRKRKASGRNVHAPLAGYEQFGHASEADRAVQSSWRQPHTNSADPGCSRCLPPPIPVPRFRIAMTGSPDLCRQSWRLSIGSVRARQGTQSLLCSATMRRAMRFLNAEDAAAVIAFDGIMVLNGLLKIRVVSTNVPDSANKIFVGGLPSYLNKEQVIELLKSCGELEAFKLVRDHGTGPSKYS